MRPLLGRLVAALGQSALALPLAALPPRWQVRRGGATRVVLHLGQHKTGTTALQRMAARHRGRLAREGVVFPRIGLARGHHGLAAPWVTMPAAALPPGGAGAAWARLGRRWGESGATLLISCENLSQVRLGAGGLVELRRALPTADEVRAVVVLRGQVGLAQSMWVEMAKRRAPPWPAAWVRAMLRTGRIGEAFGDFGRLHQQLRAAFAEEEIAYLSYDAIRAAGGSVPREVLALAGVPGRVLDGLREPEANVSAPALAVWMAQEGAPRAAADARGVARAARRLSEVAAGRPTCLFTRAEAAALAERFGALNSAFLRARPPGAAGLRLPDLRCAEGTLFRDDLARLDISGGSGA